MSFFYCTCCHFCIVLLVPLVVWLVKYLGWAFVAAAAFQHLFFGIMLHQFTGDIFQGPSTFTRVHLSLYLSFFDDIEYYAT